MRTENGGVGRARVTPWRGSSSFAARAKRVFVVVVGFDFLFFWRAPTISHLRRPPPATVRAAAQGRRRRHVIYVFSPPPHRRPRLFPTTNGRRRLTAVAVPLRRCHVSETRAFRSCVYIVTAAQAVAKRAISVKRSPLRIDIVAGSVGYYALWSRWNKWSRSFTTTAHWKNCNSRRVPLFRRSSLPGRRKKKTARIAAAPRSSVTPSTGLLAYIILY